MDRDRNNLARAFFAVNQRQAALVILALLIALLTPGSARADAPGTRGEDDVPQGGVAHPADATGQAAWAGVEQLPPPAAAPLARPAQALQLTIAQQEGDGLPWLSRTLNPGNWILDAGMGIFTGVTASVGEMLQQSTLSVLGVDASAKAGPGAWSIIPSSCGDGAVQNFVFCTPARMTYQHPGIRTVWGVLRAVATALVTLLFLVRTGRMLAEGPQSLATEGKSLVITFILVMSVVQGTESVCAFLINLFNAISESLLAGASVAFPAVSDTPFAIGARIMGAIFWLLTLMLTLKSLFRVIGIAVLVGVAPLAGALLMDRATSSRFRTWLEKLIELLLEQVALIIVFTVAAAMLAPVQDASGGDMLAQFLLGSVTMVMALFGPSAMIGIASGASSGYLASMLQMRMISGVQRGATAGARASGRAIAAGGLAAAGALAARGGDPTLSAAAKRMGQTVAQRAGRDDATRAAHVAFRLPEVEGPARDRYQRAEHLGGASALRQRAGIRAGAMLAQADGLDAAGQREAASRMRDRAALQRSFASGQDIRRTPRYGAGRSDPATGRMAVSARGQERRAIYAQALEETKARHLAEQRALKAGIAADQQLLASDAQPGTEAARRSAAERVRQRQARLAALTQTRDASNARIAIAPVTRREAATLARERWAQREAARPARPSITGRRTPEQAEAGVRLTPRRITSASPAMSRAAARRPAVRHGQTARSAASAPAAVSTSSRAQQRAQVVAERHAAHATSAFARRDALQRLAQAVEPGDAGQARRLRQEADRAADIGQRHQDRQSRASAIAAARDWQPQPSPRTPEARAARRQAFTAIRAEVWSLAEQSGLLPSTATGAERARRLELIRQSIRQLAKTRLGDLAEPTQRRRP